jgi:CubicO group peptidase (beta-lactamase class C family)
MSESFDSFRQFINDSLALWKVPGVAVAVVRGDEVLLKEGFGLRDVEAGLPVTPETLFAIGSSTKAFTTFDLGLLVDEGKLDWDKPVREFMPGFRLFDSHASEHTTPRDLVSHRVGLPRHDFMWYNSPLGREEIFKRLRYLEPNKELRETWQYQNLMFMTAGVLVEHLSGLRWEEFTRQHIFDPLGMRLSNFSVEDSQKTSDFALPYQVKEDQLKRMPFRNIDAVGPAGSINSCLEDMTRWLGVHLNGGKSGEGQLISSGNLEQMHTPQMVIPGTNKWKELLNASYGLGWFIEPYRGYQTVHHGGNIDGFSALVAFIPAEKIGVVILTNMEGQPLPGIIAYRVFDQLLGLETIDWNARFHKDFLEGKAAQEASKQKSTAERKENHPPAHTLEEYCGEYEHPGYGIVTLSPDGDKLKAVFNANEYVVEPYHYEVFEFIYDLIDMRMKGIFYTDVEGNVSRLSLPLEPSVKDIFFERVADRRLSQSSFLERLAGEYEVMGMPLRVSLKGDDQLTATLPGQPASRLVPYRGTSFKVDGVTGVTFTFKIGEDGPASEVEINQPGAVFSAKRKPAA